MQLLKMCPAPRLFQILQKYALKIVDGAMAEPWYVSVFFSMCTRHMTPELQLANKLMVGFHNALPGDCLSNGAFQKLQEKAILALADKVLVFQCVQKQADVFKQVDLEWQKLHGASAVVFSDVDLKGSVLLCGWHPQAFCDMAAIRILGLVWPFGASAGEDINVSLVPFPLRQEVATIVRRQDKISPRLRAYFKKSSGTDQRARKVWEACRTIAAKADEMSAALGNVNEEELRASFQILETVVYADAPGPSPSDIYAAVVDFLNGYAGWLQAFGAATKGKGCESGGDVAASVALSEKIAQTLIVAADYMLTDFNFHSVLMTNIMKNGVYHCDSQPVGEEEEDVADEFDDLLWQQELLKTLSCFDTAANDVVMEMLARTDLVVMSVQLGRKPMQAASFVEILERMEAWSTLWQREESVASAKTFFAPGMPGAEMQKFRISAEGFVAKQVVGFMADLIMKGGDSSHYALAAAHQLKGLLPEAVKNLETAGKAFDELQKTAKKLKEKGTAPCIDMANALVTYKMSAEKFPAWCTEDCEEFKAVSAEMLRSISRIQAMTEDAAKAVKSFNELFNEARAAIDKWCFKSVPWLTKAANAERGTAARKLERVLAQFPGWESTVSIVKERMMHVAVPELTTKLKCLSDSILQTRAEMMDAAKLYGSTFLASTLIQSDATPVRVKAAVLYMEKNIMVALADMPSFVQSKVNEVLGATDPAVSAPCTTATASMAMASTPGIHIGVGTKERSDVQTRLRKRRKTTPADIAVETVEELGPKDDV